MAQQSKDGIAAIRGSIGQGGVPADHMRAPVVLSFSPSGTLVWNS